MWIILFFLINIINLKELTMFSKELIVTNWNNFIILISIIFILIIYFIKFDFLNNIEYIKNQTLFLLTIITANLIFYSRTLWLILIIIEISVYPIIKIIMNQSKDEDKISSVKFIFIINIRGSLLIIWFITKYRFLNFYINLNRISYQNLAETNLPIFLFFSFILLRKVPIIFLQFWLSKAHVAASGKCSIILARVILKLGTYGIFKFSIVIIFLYKFLREFLFSLNLIGLIIMRLLITRFSDIKLLVAYSSIMHIALRIPIIYHCSFLSITGSIFIMVRHGLISACFFYLVTLIYELRLNRSIEINKRLESYNKTLRLFIFSLIFINLGIPPFINFFSEIFYVRTFIKTSHIYLIFAIVTMVRIIIFCIIILIKNNLNKKMVKFNKNLNTNNISILLIPLTTVLYLPFFTE